MGCATSKPAVSASALSDNLLLHDMGASLDKQQPGKQQSGTDSQSRRDSASEVQSSLLYKSTELPQRQPGQDTQPTPASVQAKAAGKGPVLQPQVSIDCAREPDMQDDARRGEKPSQPQQAEQPDSMPSSDTGTQGQMKKSRSVTKVSEDSASRGGLDPRQSGGSPAAPAAPRTTLVTPISQLASTPDECQRQGSTSSRSRSSAERPRGSMDRPPRGSVDRMRASLDRARASTSHYGSACQSQHGSLDNPRASMDSRGSAHASVHSTRSSFAAEGVREVEVDSYGRPSFAAFDPVREEAFVQGRVFEESLPDDLARAYRYLAALPPEVPVPLMVLQRMWASDSAEDAAETAHIFEMQGVLKTAQLADGTVWCLPSPQHLAQLRAAHAEALPAYHEHILEIYSHHGTIPPCDFVNDGYILLALGHHLIGTGRHADLRSLLVSPKWLEAKLHAYGVAVIVEDFRRFLQHEQDPLVKLVLQAFQMSLSACMERSHLFMMRRQLVLRLMAAAAASGNQAWYAEQFAACAEDAREAASSSWQAQHLLARTATLDQAGGMHRMVLRGHTAAIRRVAISPDGRDILTASDDGSVQVWDMDIGDCVLRLAPGGEPVALTALAVSPDGALCLTANEQGQLVAWDLQSGTALQTTQAHNGRINALVIEPSGARCLTASSDSTAKVWTLPALKCEWTMSIRSSSGLGVGNVLDVAVSANGKLAATGSDDFLIRVWDLRAKELMCTLTGHQGWVVSLQFIGSSHALVSASHDTTARVWDVSREKCMHVLEGHMGRINVVRVDDSATRAITCADDDTARIWDLAKGTCVSTLTGHGGWVNDAAITRGAASAVTVSGDRMALHWDGIDGRCINMLAGHSDEVKAVVLTSKGRFAVTASMDATARVWDLAAASLQTPEKHAGKVRSITATPDGRLAVSIGEDSVMREWDVRTGACLQKAGDPRGANLQWLHRASDGSKVLCGAGNRKVFAWDLASAGLTTCLSEQQGSRTKSMAFSADGNTAAVLLFDSTVAVWDTRTGACKAQLIKRGERDASRVHSGGVNAVYLTADASTAVTVSKDCTARVWDVAAGACRTVLEGHTDSLQCASISPDECLVATASYDNSARVWNLATGECLAALDHDGPVLQVVFSPDSKTLLTIGEGSAAWLWDIAGGRCVAALTEHRDAINSAAFAADGRLLATASRDSTVLLWEAATGRLHSIFMGDAAMTSVQFAGAPVPHTVLAGDSSGQVHFLDCPDW